MQKQVGITVSPEQTDQIVELVRRLDGVVGLRVERGVSLQPPGDTITAVVSNRTLHRLMRQLSERRIGHGSDSSITTSDLASVVSPSVREGVGRETSDLTWEELETEMGKESNMTANALLLMGIAGAVATTGMVLDALHLVIGAMIIAPGFESVTRISMGVVARSDAWRRGLLDLARGYAALLAGAVLGSVVLLLLGRTVQGESTYLAAGSLLSFWSTLTAPGVLVSALAGAAGAALIASDRSVLTAGVLVALALIPSATLVGMALVGADWALFGRALLRWTVDVVLVAVMGVAVFSWHGARLKRRQSLL